MKRTVLLSVIVSAGVVALVLAWNDVRQDREFRRLIAQGDAAVRRDQTFVAIEAFSGALALKPDSMLAHLKRGDTYRQRGEFETALRDLRQAATLDPSATRPRELLGDVNVAMGRYQRAIEQYRAYIAVDDQSPRILYKMGVAYFRDGQCTRATEALRRAVAIDDRLGEAYYVLGVCLRENSALDALSPLTRAIELRKDLAAAREALAGVLDDLGRPREAVAQLEALAALEPSRAERAAAIGLAYARTGRTDAAILKLGRAAEEYPGEAIVYTALGRVWLGVAENGNDGVALSKAIGALESASAAPTATSESLALYGRALLLAGNTETALHALEQATTRFPAEPQAFLSLATAAERLGRVAAARDALIGFVSLVPEEDEKARSQSERIADLSLRMDDPATAVIWARRATQASPANAAALGVLAAALWRTGRQDEGREVLVQALQHEPSNRTLLSLQRRFAAS